MQIKEFCQLLGKEIIKRKLNSQEEMKN